MSDLLVVVPTRGRPHNAARLAQAWADTEATADLWFAVDEDDPHLEDYLNLDVRLQVNPPMARGMAEALNTTLTDMLGRTGDRWRKVGFMGDDHVPRSPHWDITVGAALDGLGTGFVYTNDLLQGERLPTAVFCTTNIVRELGYLCFPGARHLFLDDCWLAWGQQIDRIRYLPDVIIEHMHPGNGKAPHDASYAETGQLMGPDSVAWEQYRAGRFADDVAKLRGLL